MHIKSGWYHGWNIVAVCILAQVAANGMPINAFSLFLSDWSAQLHAQKSTLLLGMAACGMSCALLAPFAGIMADKYPARWLLGGGVFGMALFCIGISTVTNVTQYLLLYGVLLSLSLLFATSVPANAVVSRWFVRRIGLALGLTAFGLSIAGVIMPPVIAAVLPALGWRVVWRIAAGVIGLVILPLVLLVVRDHPSARDGTYYLTKEGATPIPVAHGMHRAGGSSLTWRTVLGRRNFWLAVICYLPMLALYGGCMQNATPIAAGSGLSAHAAGVLLSLLSASQLAATLLGGALSDRFGSRLPLATMAFLTAGGGLLVAFSHGIWTLAPGMMLAGVGGGFWPVLAAAFSVEFGAGGLGRAFGLASFFLPIGVLAPSAMARAQETTGSYTPALLGLTAATVLGGIAALFIRGAVERDRVGLGQERRGALPPRPPLKASL